MQVRELPSEGHPICRFDFLLPPMPKTMILEPLSETDIDENKAEHDRFKLNKYRLSYDVC